MLSCSRHPRLHCSLWTCAESFSNMAAMHSAIMVITIVVVCYLQTDFTAATTCPSGYANCDYNWKNGCETNVETSVTNCGKCGVKCPTYLNTIAECSYGKCGSKCKSGWGNCNYLVADGCETCTSTNARNCGSCGKKCPSYPYSTPTCSGGKCGRKCWLGYADCDYKASNGCETNIMTDVWSCGKCGKACPKPAWPHSEATCSKGVCGVACISGYKYNWITKECVKMY